MNGDALVYPVTVYQRATLRIAAPRGLKPAARSWYGIAHGHSDSGSLRDPPNERRHVMCGVASERGGRQTLVERSQRAEKDPR